MPPTENEFDEAWEEEVFDAGDSEDEADTIRCASCAREVHAEAAICPHCNEFILAPTGYPNWVVWTAIVALLAFLATSAIWMF